MKNAYKLNSIPPDVSPLETSSEFENSKQEGITENHKSNQVSCINIPLRKEITHLPKSVEEAVNLWRTVFRYYRILSLV